jgi:hypothetical protein
MGSTLQVPPGLLLPLLLFLFLLLFLPLPLLLFLPLPLLLFLPLPLPLGTTPAPGSPRAGRRSPPRQ